jgi:hypothetical protein
MQEPEVEAQLPQELIVVVALVDQLVRPMVEMAAQVIFGISLDNIMVVVVEVEPMELQAAPAEVVAEVVVETTIKALLLQPQPLQAQLILEQVEVEAEHHQV